MILTTSMILEQLGDYANPAGKLTRLVRDGRYIPIVKGLYETDRSTSPYLLAASIYGPSYISFEYALSYYGMIPEAVCTVTCATFEKKKKKRYETPFGAFSYRDVPPEAFPLELCVMQEGDYYYRIASAEKALCDKLYTLPPAANLRELRTLLLDDLRIDGARLGKLNADSIGMLTEKYHSTNVKKLYSLLRRQTDER